MLPSLPLQTKIEAKQSMYMDRTHHLLKAVLQQLRTCHVRVPPPGSLGIPGNIMQPRVDLPLLGEQPECAGVHSFRAAEAQDPLQQAVTLLHEEQGHAMLLGQILPSACT